MKRKGVLYGIFGAGGGGELDKEEYQVAATLPPDVQILATMPEYGIAVVEVGDTAHGEGLCVSASLVGSGAAYRHCELVG